MKIIAAYLDFIAAAFLLACGLILIGSHAVLGTILLIFGGFEYALGMGVMEKIRKKGMEWD